MVRMSKNVAVCLAGVAHWDRKQAEFRGTVTSSFPRHAELAVNDMSRMPPV